jgi:uracil-DNA glycosylase family 4
VGPASDAARLLAAIAAEVTECARCPRLVAWREAVAVRSGDPEQYWARPLPGFGDPHARLLIVGLAPAAEGGNRTGRVFTGDRSGDFLFAALHRAGYANQPESKTRADGLVLRDVFVTAAVRCAPPQNKPTPAERDACARYLAAEFAALPNVSIVLALGAFGFDAALRLMRAGTVGPRPTFAHGREVPLPDGRTLVGVYHPSQRNVFTGRLTAAMFDTVLERAKTLSGVTGAVSSSVEGARPVSGRRLRATADG